MEIASQYNPKDHEKAIYASWEESGSFSPKEGKPGKEPYCIMMPPRTSRARCIWATP